MDFSKILTAILLAVIGFALWQQFYKPSYMKFYERGITYYSEDAYEKAATEFLKAISETHEYDTPKAREIEFDSYLIAGEIFDLRLGRFKQAIETYKEMVKAFPEDARIIPILGRMAEIYQIKLNDQGEAIRIYQTLLENWPRRDDVKPYRLRLVEMHTNMQEFKQVVVEGRGLLEKFPDNKDNPAIRMLVADALVYSEQWEKALEEYQRVIDLYPDSDEAKLAGFELGNCFTKLNLYPQALAAYEAALTTHPNPKVVRLRIKETKERLRNESDEDSLPEWAKHKGKRKRGYKPPMIDPFPEDKKHRGGRRKVKTIPADEFPSRKKNLELEFPEGR